LTSLHFCTSDSWGGLELYAATLMIELSKVGVNIIAICKPGSKIYEHLSAHNIKCESMPGYDKLNFAAVKRIKSLITEHDAKVLHVHFHRDIWPASMALRSDNKRKLYLSIYMGVGRKKDILHRWIYSRVNGVFTSSRELNSRLPELYPINKERIHYLPYGRTISDYSIDPVNRAEIRSRHGFSEDETVVGTMIRIDPGKGVMDFVKSIALLDPKIRKKVKYLIVGEPTRKASSIPGESPYERNSEVYYREILAFILKNDLNDTIIFTGYKEDAIGYLSAMDIFVFPSRDELYSLVVLEAMCLRLPIVAAKAGGNISQIEDDRSGLLYEVADSGDLARKLTRYIESPELRKEHGEEARRFVEKEHTMKEIINRLLLFYV
jgi:glycosyltransferase involved in cell wall biosynthesis